MIKLELETWLAKERQMRQELSDGELIAVPVSNQINSWIETAEYEALNRRTQERRERKAVKGTLKGGKAK